MPLPRSKNTTLRIAKWERPEHRQARLQWYRSHPVRVARKEQGISTRELAKEFEVSTSKIGTIERGEVTTAKARGLLIRMAPYLSLDPFGLVEAVERWHATAMNEPWATLKVTPRALKGSRNPLTERAIQCWIGWSPVRNIRERAGFNAKEFAKMVGISYIALQRIEREGYVNKLRDPLLEYLSALSGRSPRRVQADYRAWKDAKPNDKTAADFLGEYSHDGRNLLAPGRRVRRVRGKSSRGKPQSPEVEKTGELLGTQVRTQDVRPGANQEVESVPDGDSPDKGGSRPHRRSNPRPWYGRGV